MAAFIKSVSLFLLKGRRASRVGEGESFGGGGGGGGAPADKNDAPASRATTGGTEQRRGQGNQGTKGTRGTTAGSQQAGAGKKGGAMAAPRKAAAAANKCSSGKLVESLRRRTHFSRGEVAALLRLHRSIAASAQRRPQGRGQAIVPIKLPGQGADGNRALLDRASFRELLHNSLDLTEEMLMERIFNAFDRRGEGAIDGERWVLGLSVLLKGTPAERRTFCFGVYDLNGDGFVSREEVLQLLAGSLAAPAAADDDPDEGVRDLADLALRKMDADKDGRLSFADFETAVSAEPLLLEAFGNCLPSDHMSDSFLATLL